jgi:L-asparaginase
MRELMRKDSLDMEIEDREKVYETVYNSGAQKILITHGTDTMIKT